MHRLTILLFLILLPISALSNERSVPYFASIKSKADEANIRTGPSIKYPIRWVYKRPFWPVQVTATFEDWRKISDRFGEAGWIHKSLLSGKRMVTIKTDGVQEIYRLPITTANVVMIAEDQVIAKLLQCKKQWCKISIEEQEGWVEAAYLWGVEE